MNSTIYFLAFYCDRPDHLIFATVHLMVEIFFGYHYAYMHQALTIGVFTREILMIVAYFACTAFSGMAFIYCIDLRITLSDTN